MTRDKAILVLNSLLTWLGYERPITEEIVEAIKTISKPYLPSNIDDAAEEYAYNNWEDNDYHTGASEGLPFDAIGHTEKCFKAGAEWQREQDSETIELAEDHAILAGMMKERKQMLKDAVDGEVVSDLKGVNYVRSMSKISDDLRFGKKVKLIIIKKEEQ